MLHDHSSRLSAARRLFAGQALRRLAGLEQVCFLWVSGAALAALLLLDLRYTQAETAQSGTALDEVGVAGGGAVLFPILCFIVSVIFVLLLALRRIAGLCLQNPFEALTDALTLLDCTLLCFDTPYSAHLVYGRSIFGATDADSN